MTKWGAWAQLPYPLLVNKYPLFPTAEWSAWSQMALPTTREGTGFCAYGKGAAWLALLPIKTICRGNWDPQLLSGLPWAIIKGIQALLKALTIH